MATYKTDKKDILFTLNDVLNCSRHSKYGFEADDIQSIVVEFDKFLENEIFPTREPSDLEGVKMRDGLVYAPSCLHAPHKNFHENGWFAIGFPEEIGGTPVPEALSTCCTSLASGANLAWQMYPGLAKGAMNVIRMVGTDQQKSTYLTPMIEGRWGGTMCLTEPGAGSDVGALRTTATPNDDGSYNIKGIKIFISSGESDLYENNIHLVLAKTPNAPEGTKGISLFIVPRFYINDDGSLGDNNDVVCTKIEHKMGIHASATCEMTFGQNGTCKGWLIGKEFEGMKNMFIMMNEARLLVGVQGESQANMAYQMALTYAKERNQFGQEIINHPDVRRMLLKMRANGRGMRAICFYMADMMDAAEADPKYQGIVDLMTPVCKGYCTDEGMAVASEAVQVHGGYGYCTEYGVEQFLRDTKITQIYEGTNGIQAIDFTTRKVLKDQAKTLMWMTEQMQETLGKMDDAKWSSEKAIFNKALESGATIIKMLGEKAQNKEIDIVLQNASDFLRFTSILIVAWRLMEAALVAEKQLPNAQGEDKEFLQSKCDDVTIYCHHYLNQAIGLGKTITGFNGRLSELGL